MSNIYGGKRAHPISASCFHILHAKRKPTEGAHQGVLRFQAQSRKFHFSRDWVKTSGELLTAFTLDYGALAVFNEAYPELSLANGTAGRGAVYSSLVAQKSASARMS